MPDIQFWDDKLTQEIQLIQILVTSRDDLHAKPQDDEVVDGLMRTATRTRRCFGTQTKMLKKDDPTQKYFTSRLGLLDTQLAALEQDWQTVDRTYADVEDSAEFSASSQPQSDHSSIEMEYVNKEMADDTQRTAAETVMDDSTHQSLTPFDRPRMVRSDTTFRCGPQGQTTLMRKSGGRRLLDNLQ